MLYSVPGSEETLTSKTKGFCYHKTYILVQETKDKEVDKCIFNIMYGNDKCFEKKIKQHTGIE